MRLLYSRFNDVFQSEKHLWLRLVTISNSGLQRPQVAKQEAHITLPLTVFCPYISHINIFFIIKGEIYLMQRSSHYLLLKADVQQSIMGALKGVTVSKQTGFTFAESVRNTHRHTQASEVHVVILACQWTRRRTHLESTEQRKVLLFRLFAFSSAFSFRTAPPSGLLSPCPWTGPGAWHVSWEHSTRRVSVRHF